MTRDERCIDPGQNAEMFLIVYASQTLSPLISFPSIWPSRFAPAGKGDPRAPGFPRHLPLPESLIRKLVGSVVFRWEEICATAFDLGIDVQQTGATRNSKQRESTGDAAWRFRRRANKTITAPRGSSGRQCRGYPPIVRRLCRAWHSKSQRRHVWDRAIGPGSACATARTSRQKSQIDLR